MKIAQPLFSTAARGILAGVIAYGQNSNGPFARIARIHSFRTPQPATPAQNNFATLQRWWRQRDPYINQTWRASTTAYLTNQYPPTATAFPQDGPTIDTPSCINLGTQMAPPI